LPEAGTKRSGYIINLEWFLIYSIYIDPWMKNVLFTLCAVLAGNCVYSQEWQSAPDTELVTDVIIRPGSAPVFYIGPGTGINNNTGYLGVAVERPGRKDSSSSLGGGVGISTWGIKMCVEPKHYFRSRRRGWAVACGATLSAGRKNYRAEMYTNGSTHYGGHAFENVTLTLLPQLAGYVAMYHYWPIGDKARFYIALGWSQCLTSDKFRTTRGDPVDMTSPEATNLVLLFAPGGPVIATGFSIGCYRKADKTIIHRKSVSY
jgi:hypothetical protein